MKHNKIGVCHVQLNNSNSVNTSNVQSRTFFEHFRRGKLIWIKAFSIVALFIILGITISKIIMIMKKKSTTENLSTIITTKTTITTSKTTITISTTISTTEDATTEQLFSLTQIHDNTKWKQYGSTIAGGNQGNKLSYPLGIHVSDHDQTIYIADTENHRVVQWKSGANNGVVVAGGKGEGNRIDQLDTPKDVIFDKNNNSLIICDQGSDRVVRWSPQNRTYIQTIISNIDCSGLTMDDNGDLYVSNYIKNEVRRWREGETNGIIVAGGNGPGGLLNQLHYPSYLIVDQNYSVYVSDRWNHRVMKWMRDATEGVVVAGGQGRGNSLTHLSDPFGIIVDHLGNVYVADFGNNRVMRWLVDAKQGTIIIGENGKGNQPNQFDGPTDLSFDRQGNIYVLDFSNHRAQKFHVDID